MSASWSSAAVLSLLTGAALLLILDLILSVALAAVAALSRVALRRLSSEGGPRLAFVEQMNRPPSAHRSAAMILRQLSLLGATLLVAWAAQRAGLERPMIAGVAIAGLLGVVLLESAVARSVAVWKPRQALRLTAVFVHLAYLLFYPLVALQHLFLRWIEAGQRRSEEEREEEQEEEVEALIEVGERTGLLEAAEGEMMRGIVDLDETMVREILTPRTDIVALEARTKVAEARRRLLEAGHSRLPVYTESIDNVIGVLHSRDLFQAWERGQEEQPVSHFLRPAIFVPETLSAADLLAEMRQKTQIALVVDEYGGIAGLVTLEDLLEEIVGDIRDEHDRDEEQLVRQESDSSWIVDAVTHVDELETLFDVDFGERDFDTVGGLVIWRCGRVPRVGESLDTHGLHLEVLQADNRRVQRVRVRRAESPGEAAGDR